MLNILKIPQLLQKMRINPFIFIIFEEISHTLNTKTDMAKEISRRSFLKTGTAAALGLSMMPGKVFAKGGNEAPAPLDR